MPRRFFGMTDAGPRTGIVFGIYTLGSLTGALPASHLPDRIGRRWSMFFGNAIIIIGALITATSKDRGTFIGGRYLTGTTSSHPLRRQREAIGCAGTGVF